MAASRRWRSYTTTGEIEKTTLKHEENIVREFYSNLPRPVRVGIEATGSMQCFVNLMEELGIECLVRHPAEIRAAEPRKQKHDRRDADLILTLLDAEQILLPPPDPVQVSGAAITGKYVFDSPATGRGTGQSTTPGPSNFILYNVSDFEVILLESDSIVAARSRRPETRPW
jgi:hypothetical protein